MPACGLGLIVFLTSATLTWSAKKGHSKTYELSITLTILVLILFADGPDEYLFSRFLTINAELSAIFPPQTSIECSHVIGFDDSIVKRGQIMLLEETCWVWLIERFESEKRPKLNECYMADLLTVASGDMTPPPSLPVPDVCELPMLEEPRS